MNPAPATPAAGALLDAVDVVVPNQHELLTLLGREENVGHSEVERAAAELAAQVPCVVTLGARGALVAEGGKVAHVPPLSTAVVDTTGAGDAFCAGLSVALARGADLYAAARYGSATGALAVRAVGAQASLPTEDDVLALLDL